MRPLYLDHNATSPLHPAALEAMRPVLAGAVGNPSSAHGFGRKARQALDDARETVARLLRAAFEETVFTSGATEANNLAILGLAGEPPGHLLCSPVEHPCVIEPVRYLASRGFDVDWLPVSATGHVDVAAVTAGCHLDTRLVCLMLANHETGAIQPVREVVASLPTSVRLHCDAAQAVGKVPVNFRDLGAATLAASAHKFQGPVGIGVLLVRKGIALRSVIHGGPQQGGRRPGTPSVALAVGMAAALEQAVAAMDATRMHLERLRATLWHRLRELAAPVVLNGPAIGAAEAMPTTLNVSFPGCRADVLLMSLDLAGIACSTGSACSSGSLLPSPVLAAMGVSDDVLRSAMRFSFGPSLTLEDVEEAAVRIAECVRRLRG